MKFLNGTTPFSFMRFISDEGELQTVLLPTFADLWHFDETVEESRFQPVCPSPEAHLAVQGPFSSATSLSRRQPKSSV